MSHRRIARDACRVLVAVLVDASSEPRGGRDGFATAARIGWSRHSPNPADAPMQPLPSTTWHKRRGPRQPATVHAPVRGLRRVLLPELISAWIVVLRTSAGGSSRAETLPRNDSRRRTHCLAGTAHSLPFELAAWSPSRSSSHRWLIGSSLSRDIGGPSEPLLAGTLARRRARPTAGRLVTRVACLSGHCAHRRLERVLRGRRRIRYGRAPARLTTPKSSRSAVQLLPRYGLAQAS